MSDHNDQNQRHVSLDMMEEVYRRGLGDTNDLRSARLLLHAFLDLCEPETRPAKPPENNGIFARFIRWFKVNF